MTADPNKAAALQEEGSREFDAAVAGKGPALPAPAAVRESESDLDEGLRETFPASDPPELSSNETGLGAPDGRRSAT
jgi:hypothetical protein